MLSTFAKVLELFPRRDRRQLFLMAPAILLMAVLQVAGIGMVMPFISVVANPAGIQQHRTLKWAYDAFGFHDSSSFLLMIGFAAFGILLIGNTVSGLITWWMVRFAEMRTHHLASILLQRYLSRPYIYFLDEHSAELGVKVLSDVVQVVTGILLPGLQLLAQTAMALFLVLLLFAVQPALSLIVVVGLGGAYFTVYRVVRGRLATYGQIKADANGRQFRALSEASGAIKEIKLLNLEREFLERFKRPNLAMANAVAMQSVFAIVPHYVMETIAFGGILAVVIYMLASGQRVAEVMPALALYTYAILRIKPALQTAYTSVTQIRFNEPVLNRVHAEMNQLNEAEMTPAVGLPVSAVRIPLRDRIELRAVTFSYPNSGRTLFQDLNLSIGSHTSVAFVGPTGSGKTTIVDIILGLLAPDSGVLAVDGVPITDENRRSWQANVSYVPQHIYLSDSSIKSNIAFGVPADRVEMKAVEDAARNARIHDFVSTQLPLGYETLVGERGVRLSGGQRQRIGIARALYRNAQVLLLDEATSALDGITEDSVFESMKDIAGTRTIILVAHRLSTVRHCDEIFMMDHGHIVARGTFDELLMRSEQFRAMAHLSRPEVVRAG